MHEQRNFQRPWIPAACKLALVVPEAGRSRLLFGSGKTLGAVYQSLADGASLDDAIAQLG
jgi:hypothetical protein